MKTSKKITAVFLMIVMLLGAFSTNLAYAAAGMQIYVSPDGDDNNNGTKDSPLKTFAAAKQMVRTMKKQSGLPSGGVEVLFMEGEYYIETPQNFDEADSGAQGSPITYKSFDGQKAVFMGGITLDGESFEAVTDDATLSRFVPEAKGKILKFDLGKIGLTREIVGEQKYIGAYAQPEYQSNTPRYGVNAELYCNDEAMTVARYPNEDFIYIKQVYNPGSAYYNDVRNNNGYSEAIPFEIGYEGTRPSRWLQATDAKMYGYYMYDWADSTVDLAAIDKRKKTLKSNQATAYGVKVADGIGGRYYVFNLLEEIDMPGEYYIDRDNMILYYYPKTDDLKTENLQLSLTESALFSMSKASYINFENLEITTSRGGGFYLSECNSVVIGNTKIKNLGSRAIQIVDGDNCGAYNCEIYNVDGGIYLTGMEGFEELAPSGNFAVNNHIYQFNRLTATYTPGISVYGMGLYVAHNEIHGGGHLAIQMGTAESVVEYNNIYDVLQDTSDAGAIYWGQSMVKRSTVRYNYIHDFGVNQHNIGGIYMDDFQSGDRIYGNIIANSGTDNGAIGVICGGGREIEVHDNIFVNMNMASMLYNLRSEGHAYISPGGSVYKGIESVNQNPIFKSRYPRLSNALNDQLHIPKYSQFYNNIALDCAPSQIDMLAYEHGDITDAVNTSKKQTSYHFSEDGMINFDIQAVKKLVPDIDLPDFEKIGLQKNFSKEDINIDFKSVQKPVELTEEQKLQGLNIFALDAKNMLINNELKPLSETATDVKPILINDSTYVPLRAIAEALGKYVFWDERGLIIISDVENPLNKSSDSELIEKLLQQLAGQ